MQKKTQFLWRHRNWVFATNLNFLIPISFQPNDVNFDISNYLIDQNSKLEISEVYNIGLQRYTWILKSEFIAKKNSVPMKAKELSFCHKLKFFNPYIFKTWWCKPLIFLTLTIWSTRIHSLKYQRSTSSDCKDISGL